MISAKLKEDIKKLQELTKEANKIMTNKVNNKDENNQEVLSNSPENLMKVGRYFTKSKDWITVQY